MSKNAFQVYFETLFPGDENPVDKLSSNKEGYIVVEEGDRLKWTLCFFKYFFFFIFITGFIY